MTYACRWIVSHKPVSTQTVLDRVSHYLSMPHCASRRAVPDFAGVGENVISWVGVHWIQTLSETNSSKSPCSMSVLGQFCVSSPSCVRLREVSMLETL